MKHIIRSVDEITPAFLTTVLRERGLLPNGEVLSVKMDCHRPFLAEVCTLILTVSDGTPPSVPRRLFLKFQPGNGPLSDWDTREVRFYQLMMEGSKTLPIPTPYYAAYDEHSGAINLLLADLSENYTALQHELPPSEKQCYQVMSALAQVHAYWWESPQLSSLVDARTEDALKAEFAQDVENYQQLSAFLGDRLMPSRRNIFEQIIEHYLPLRLDRFAGQRKVTLTHGDAHAWNFMYPANHDDLPILLDWEAMGINFPPFDAAYLMTVFWHPARRAWLEKPLLRHYHAGLLKQGVKDYSWEECWRDYQLSVISLVFEPAWWWKRELPAFLWWHRLERIMMAYEDLDCASLLA